MPVQKKGLLDLEWKLVYRLVYPAKFLPCREDLFRGRGNGIAVEGFTPLQEAFFAIQKTKMQRSSTQLVDSEVVRHLKQEGAGVIEVLRSLHTMYAQKSFLCNLRSILGAIQFTCEELLQ